MADRNFATFASRRLIHTVRKPLRSYKHRVLVDISFAFRNVVLVAGGNGSFVPCGQRLARCAFPSRPANGVCVRGVGKRGKHVSCTHTLVLLQEKRREEKGPFYPGAVLNAPGGGTYVITYTSLSNLTYGSSLFSRFSPYRLNHNFLK